MSTTTTTTKIPDLPPNEKQRVRERLTLFYTNHAPDNMAAVDKAMTMQMTEEVIFEKLHEKYRVSPADEERAARAKGVFPGGATPAESGAAATSRLKGAPAVNNSSEANLVKMYNFECNGAGASDSSSPATQATIATQSATGMDKSQVYSTLVQYFPTLSAAAVHSRARECASIPNSGGLVSLSEFLLAAKDLLQPSKPQQHQQQQEPRSTPSNISNNNKVYGSTQPPRWPSAAMCSELRTLLLHCPDPWGKMMDMFTSAKMRDLDDGSSESRSNIARLQQIFAGVQRKFLQEFGQTNPPRPDVAVQPHGSDLPTLHQLGEAGSLWREFAAPENIQRYEEAQRNSSSSAKPDPYKGGLDPELHEARILRHIRFNYNTTHWNFMVRAGRLTGALKQWRSDHNNNTAECLDTLRYIFGPEPDLNAFVPTPGAAASAGPPSRAAVASARAATTAKLSNGFRLLNELLRSTDFMSHNALVDALFFNGNLQQQQAATQFALQPHTVFNATSDSIRSTLQATSTNAMTMISPSGLQSLLNRMAELQREGWEQFVRDADPSKKAAVEFYNSSSSVWINTATWKLISGVMQSKSLRSTEQLLSMLVQERGVAQQHQHQQQETRLADLVMDLVTNEALAYSRTPLSGGPLRLASSSCVAVALTALSRDPTASAAMLNGGMTREQLEQKRQRVLNWLITVAGPVVSVSDTRQQLAFVGALPRLVECGLLSYEGCARELKLVKLLFEVECCLFGAVSENLLLPLLEFHKNVVTAAASEDEKAQIRRAAWFVLGGGGDRHPEYVNSTGGDRLRPLFDEIIGPRSMML